MTPRDPRGRRRAPVLLVDGLLGAREVPAQHRDTRGHVAPGRGRFDRAPVPIGGLDLPYDELSSANLDPPIERTRAA